MNFWGEFSDELYACNPDAYNAIVVLAVSAGSFGKNEDILVVEVGRLLINLFERLFINLFEHFSC